MWMIHLDIVVMVNLQIKNGKVTFWNKISNCAHFAISQ